MKKGTVYVWHNIILNLGEVGRYWRGTEKFIGQISIDNGMLTIIPEKEENYRHLTIPLTSVMMVEWEK